METEEPKPFGDPAIRVSMMPKDTNHTGTIFGGVILSYLDLAGAVEASVTIDIIVEAVRKGGSGEKVRVMEAEVVYVAVDNNRHPIPIQD
jgi:acyl-CoA hydrolase